MPCSARLNRLFAEDGKCFDLAIDHGFFNELEFLCDIEDMKATVETGVEAGPDAIQVARGQAHYLQEVAGRRKPSLVLRLDTANVYARNLSEHLFTRLIGDPAGTAVRLDAACAILNFFYMPDRQDLYRQSVENLNFAKAECERYGMPLMVEPLVMLPGARGGYQCDSDPDRIVPLVRQVAEMGADIIKCEPTARSADFHRVVQAACGKPVLPRGGGRMAEDAIFARTWELMEEGASGIVYGRNIFQHPKPKLMTRAFMAIVHEGAMPQQAREILAI